MIQHRKRRSQESGQRNASGVRLILLCAGITVAFVSRGDLEDFLRQRRFLASNSPARAHIEKDTRQQKEGETIQLLDLPPQTSTIVLNVGSNRDPILPKESAGPCARSIAFEPIVPELVPAHPQLFVIPAAVSSDSYLATMYSYNNYGASSSLSKPAASNFWNEGRRNKGVKIVPVVSMMDVIRAVPTNVTIDFVQTDAQGYDFLIVKSAAEAFKERGVQYLKTEVWTNNVVTYQGVENDLCQQWIPMMNQNGYSLVGVIHHDDHTFRPANEAQRIYCVNNSNIETSKPGLKEADALWKLSSIADDPPQSQFQYPIHDGRKNSFTAEQTNCGMS